MYKNMISYTILFYIIFNLKDFLKNINKENIFDDNIFDDNIFDENESKNENYHIFNKIKDILLKYKLKLSKNISKIHEKNKENIESKEDININSIECNTIVLYQHKKQSNYNLKDIYDNFFKKKVHKINKEIDIDILKNISIKNDLKSNIILTENKNNILLDENNNFIIYNFDSIKNNYYKIKCKLTVNNIKNIKLIINDRNKKFVYDFLEETEYSEEIKEYSFILDYNNFNINDSIFIYLLFYNDSMNNINIDNLSIEIIENKIVKNNLKLFNSIIIFNINDKYLPIYTNVENILDFEKNENDYLFFF